jgi:hypothetical protein
MDRRSLPFSVRPKEVMRRKLGNPIISGQTELLKGFENRDHWYVQVHRSSNAGLTDAGCGFCDNSPNATITRFAI